MASQGIPVRRCVERQAPFSRTATAAVPEAIDRLVI